MYTTPTELVEDDNLMTSAWCNKWWPIQTSIGGLSQSGLDQIDLLAIRSPVKVSVAALVKIFRHSPEFSTISLGFSGREVPSLPELLRLLYQLEHK